MKKFFRKKIALYALPLALLGAAVPAFAHAGLFDVIPSVPELIGQVLLNVAYIVNTVFSFLFMVAGMLVQFTLKLNLEVTNLDLNPIIRIGWQVTRDLANLIFVFAAIIMGFGTIISPFAGPDYGWKKMLPRIVTAAIMVNFSLAIAGLCIDFSNVATNFFLAKASNRGVFGFTESLAAAFSPQKFLMPDQDNPLPPDPSQSTGIGKFGAAMVTTLVSTTFIVLFTAVATIIMLCIAVLFFIRYFKLAFLLIMAPVTWAGRVFPQFKSHHGKWWGEFTQQLMFGPSIGFFMYLALTMVDEYGAMKSMPAEFFKAGAIQQIIASGMPMIMIGGILVMGLVTAEKAGSGLAGVANKKLKAMGQGAMANFRERASAWRQNAAQGQMAQAVGTGAVKLSSTIKNISTAKDDDSKTVRAGRMAFRTATRAATGFVPGLDTQNVARGLERFASSRISAKGAEKIVPESIGSAMARSYAGTKPQPAERSQQQLEKEQKRLLGIVKEKKSLGFSEAEYKIDEANLRKVEEELGKKTKAPENLKEFEERFGELAKRRAEFAKEALDTSYLDNVATALKDAAMKMKADKPADITEKIGKLSEARDSFLKEHAEAAKEFNDASKALEAADSAPGMTPERKEGLKRNAAAAKKHFDAVQKHLDTFAKDIAALDKELAAKETADKMRSGATKKLEETLADLTKNIDTFVAEGNQRVSHPRFAEFEELQKVVRDMSEIDKRSPKKGNKAAWAERATALENVATVIGKHNLAATSPEILGELQAKIDEAKKNS